MSSPALQPPHRGMKTLATLDNPNEDIAPQLPSAIFLVNLLFLNTSFERASP
jgi:hypothetical protein